MKDMHLLLIICFRSWRKWHFAPAPKTKFEGASEMFPGNNNSDYDLECFLSSVIVTKARGKAICILIDLQDTCQKCQLVLLNYFSLFTFFRVFISQGRHWPALPFHHHLGAWDKVWAKAFSLEPSRKLVSFWAYYLCSGNSENVLQFAIPPGQWRGRL